MDKERNNTNERIKLYILIMGVGVFFLVFIVKLFSLQVTNTNYFSEQAFNNKKQIIKIPTVRGRIFLSDGKVLADNKLSYAFYMIPYYFPRKSQDPNSFNKILNVMTNRLAINYGSIVSAFRKGRQNPYSSYLLKKNVPFEDVLYLAENLNNFPGLIYQEVFDRIYPGGDMYSHITGYVHNISISELQRKQNLGYDANSVIGKLGIESYYDLKLRGQEGYKVNIVDVKNRIKEEIYPEDGKAKPGSDITLSIVPNIQKIVYDVLDGFKGAIIVSKVSTGEVLALHSYPTYDPNIFSGVINSEKVNKLLKDDDRPFFNRAIQGEYPLGSVFKLAVALTALDNPTFDYRKKTYYCSGGLYIGDKYFKCEGVHGTQNLLTAIPNSCNVFFYKLGLDLGPNLIARYSKDYFNFGLNTGIDIAYEKKGQVPSPQWKIERQGAFWWDGDTVNFSIGQGYFSATVAQANLLTSAIANDGIAYKPTILAEEQTLGTSTKVQVNREVVIRLPFDKNKLKIIQRTMRDVVRWGTARRIENNKIKIAGKTGTSQVSGKDDPHSWFSAYAPYDAPPEKRLAVTVLIENGGYGSIYSAVFAEAIFQAIFNSRNPNLVVKERLQFFNANENKYDQWLKIKKQKPLPANYFNNDKKTL